MNNYGFFIVNKIEFYSPMLVEKVLPLERKRAKVCPGNAVSVPKTPCNSLEINSGSFKEEKRII